MQGEDDQQNAGDNGDFYQPQNGGGFAGRDDSQPDFESRSTGEVVDWQASEYIHHSKGAGWLIIMVVIALAIMGVAIWLQQWIFAILTVIMAVTFGVYAFRQPRDVQYHLSDDGLRINDKTYAFDVFRAFGVIPEGAFYTIQLIPVKRFMPAVTIYFAQPDGERIVDIIGSHLPLQEMQPDPVEAFMRRLRF